MAISPTIARAKPVPGQTPDLQHPFASGMVSAFMLNEGSGQMISDCISGMRGFFRNGTPTWVPTAFGSGVRFNGSSDIGNFTAPRFSYDPSSTTGGVAGPFTIIAGLRVNSSSGFGTIYAAGNAGFYTNSGSFVYFNSQTAASAFTLNTPIVVGASASSGFAKPIYLMENGVLNGQTASGNVPTIDPLALIGGHGSEYFNGDISFIYVYNRYMPPEMMTLIHADPFAMFDDWDYSRRITFIGAAVSHAGTASTSTFAALSMAP